jgi:6-phosphogluconolactonase (cycloisomerase 2 family)
MNDPTSLCTSINKFCFPQSAAARIFLCAAICCIAAGSTAQLPGTLTFMHDDALLGNMQDIEASPDGKFLYVAARSSSIQVYTRNEISGTFSNRTLSGGGTGGTDKIALAVSPDGAHIYTVSLQDDTLSVYSRDPGTGLVTFIESHADGIGGVDGLDGSHAAAVSPDGLHVYTGANVDDAVSVFARNPATGQLTFVEANFNGVGGVTGMDAPVFLAFSPDGANLYAAGSSLIVFSRDAGTGALTFLQSPGTGGFTVVSPDGAHVYSGGNLATYSRDLGTGALTFIENGVDGGRARDGIAMTKDGAHLYVVGHSSFVHFLRRNTVSGTLTYVRLHQIGVQSETQHATDVVLSPDDANVYVTTHWSENLTAYRREPTGLDITTIPRLPIEEGEVLRMIAPAGLSYQWKRNGVNIVDSPPRVTGASTPELVLDPALIADSDTYSVVLDDATRAIVESNPLTLKVHEVGGLPAARWTFLALSFVGICAYGVVKVRRKRSS